MANPAKDEYRACGQQVLLNGSHYADARDPDAATAIAYALNSLYLAKLGPPNTKNRLVTITIGVARNGDIHEDTQCHNNSFAEVYRGMHAVRARVDELIRNRRECPFNPKGNHNEE